MSLTLYYQGLKSTFAEKDRKSTDSFERTHDIKMRLHVQNVQFEVECSVHIFVCEDETNENNYENENQLALHIWITLSQMLISSWLKM